MSASLNRSALRSLQREARHLIHEQGVLNHNEVLQRVLELVHQQTGRTRPTPITWAYLCDVIETSYVLGLVVGTHFTNLRAVVNDAATTGGRDHA